MTVKYQDYLIRDFISETTGTKAVNIPITILISGTTAKATLFDDNGVEIDNPVITDSEGYYSFNVDAGSYDFIADYDQPSENQDVIYEDKLIFSSTVTPGESDSIRAITLAQMKVEVDSVVGDTFTISDRYDGKFKAVSSTGLTANEIDIIASDVNPSIYYIYQPDGYTVNIDHLGAVGDFDQDTRTGTDDTNAWKRAVEIADNPQNYAVLKMDLLLPRRYFVKEGVTTTAIADSSIKFKGISRAVSGVYTDQDIVLITYGIGVKAENIEFGGPAYYRTTTDYRNAANTEFLNSRCFSTSVDGSSFQAAWVDMFSVNIKGFKYGVWNRASLWCNFKEVRTRNLCGFAFARNSFPDDQSNPNAPAGWNSYNPIGWFHNVVTLKNVLLEDKEVGIYGCPTLIHVDTCTAQLQLSEKANNRVLPVTQDATGVCLFSGVDGQKQAWTAKFTEFYAEACKQPVNIRDYLEVGFDGVFTQGFTAQAPYDTPLILNNAKATVDRWTGQSYFRTHAILTNGAELYGDLRGAYTEGGDSIDIDADSKWYRTGSNIEKYYGTYVSIKQNGEANKQFVYRDHALQINTCYSVSAFVVYDGLPDQSVAVTYKILRYNSSVNPVISTVSIDNNNGLAANILDYFDVGLELEGSDIFVKLETKDPVTKQMALRVTINQESAIPTLENTVAAEDVTTGLTVRRSAGAGGNSVNVQRGSLSLSRNQQTNVTISTVDLDKSYLIVSVKNGIAFDSVSSQSFSVGGELTTGTNISFQAGNGPADNQQSATVYWEVVTHD